MTTNELTKEVVRLRREKGLTQNQVADKLGIKRSTYAKKEVEADFEPEEIFRLSKLLHNSKLIELFERIIRIDDWKDFLIKSTINLNATQRVVLMVLAEILAKQRGQKISETLRNLLEDVEAEKSLHPIR
jgi:DNA-binding XRE family transcriptional regulator